jgi:hypothetical protein
MEIHPAPTPFCYNPQKVKAIVLGADPSNFSDNGKRKILNKVFGIGDGDARYFQGILKNLREVELGLEDIYVDNLIQDYLDSETSKNKNWDTIAKLNIPICLKRLDAVDKKRILPVLHTTEAIYKVVCPNNPISAKQFYFLKESIPTPPSENELKRPIIPFYRHKDNNLSLPKNSDYKSEIKKILTDS